MHEEKDLCDVQYVPRWELLRVALEILTQLGMCSLKLWGKAKRLLKKAKQYTTQTDYTEKQTLQYMFCIFASPAAEKQTPNGCWRWSQGGCVPHQLSRHCHASWCHMILLWDGGVVCCKEAPPPVQEKYEEIWKQAKWRVSSLSSSLFHSPTRYGHGRIVPRIPCPCTLPSLMSLHP